jgi:hypothetical protein
VHIVKDSAPNDAENDCESCLVTNFGMILLDNGFANEEEQQEDEKGHVEA